MKELIDEMSYDLAECHVDYLDDAKLYTDYDTMAQKMVSRGYRKQSEWISVGDRLPEKNIMVLGYYHHVYESGGSFDMVLVMELNKEGYFVPFNCSPIRDKSVTHWMPLPQPPKMKGGAE